MPDKAAPRQNLPQTDFVSGAPEADLLDRRRLDAFTHARLWKNPCGFAARFNYLALRYNVPLYGWVEEQFGLSRVEFVVIYSLAIQDGVTASDIASSTAFPKNTLSRAVNRLVKLGLIQRRAGAQDRRMQILSLTHAGRAIYETALPRFAGLEREMLAPLSLVEREMLSTLLAKVVLAMFQGQAGAGQPEADENGAGSADSGGADTVRSRLTVPSAAE